MVNGDLGYITEEPMTSTTSSKRMFPAESGTVDNFILRPTASQSIYVTTNVHYVTMIMTCDHIVCRQTIDGLFACCTNHNAVCLCCKFQIPCQWRKTCCIDCGTNISNIKKILFS